MAQMPALIPKEVEIQRLKKIWMIIIAMGSTAASVEVDNFVDGFSTSDFYQRQRIYSSTLVAILSLCSIATRLGICCNL